jgi:hypothetical protein
MALVYGLDGIRQRSYRVWLVYPDSGSVGWDGGEQTLSNYITLITDKISVYEYYSAWNDLGYFISAAADIVDYSEKLGECRKDSIVLTAEDGESIEGNEIGTIILGKNCSFSCELLNATPANINTLYSDVEAQTPFYIMLEEVDGQTKMWPTGNPAPNDYIESNDTHEIIFVGVNNALVANIVENHIGGGISTITLSANDTVAKVSDFRVIMDIPYDLDDIT